MKSEMTAFGIQITDGNRSIVETCIVLRKPPILTSGHSISSHMTSSHLTSSHLTSSHVTSSSESSSHVTSSRLKSSNMTSYGNF
jgi:hypothetical protein